jgi:predicted transcriptional regulator
MSRLTVEFSDDVSKLLSRLADDNKLSKSDVLRRAIALYEYADRESKSDPDKRLSITKDGQKLTDIVLT